MHTDCSKKTCLKRRVSRLSRMIICFALCVSFVICLFPQTAYAGKLHTMEFTMAGFVQYGYGNNQKDSDKGSDIESIYQYETAENIDEVINICKKYSNKSTTTGVRNQIDWMNQLYVTAVQDFNAKLDLGDTLLIALLNHSDINTTLMTSPYSMDDINRVLAKQIADGKEGYVDIDAIAKATGLSVQDVSDILKRIASGSITEKTISTGKNSSQHTNRGPYLKIQAQKQEKVFNYLKQEVERMTGDSDALELLYNDLGAGYVNNLLAGTEIDQYRVMLYKEHLAKTLDSTIESVDVNSLADDISKTGAYKVTKKTRSALSKVYKYVTNAANESLSDELKSFFDKALENGVFSESEAREYLILSGEYEKGEHGIGTAAKQLSKGYKYLQKLDTAIEVSGKVFDTVDKVKKAEEFIEYWATDYAQQEIMLEYMVESLSDSGADMDLMVAAKELQNEYTDKLSGTFDKVYTELINKGVGTLKSAFPPLGIAESCISLAGMLTGADDHVDAIETGLAMQGICKQALEDYENAVKAVCNGDSSEEAVNRVLTNFEIARQSLVSYYKAMVQLAETDAEKNLYSSELAKLEKAEFGYVTVSVPFGGGGSMGVR